MSPAVAAGVSLTLADWVRTIARYGYMCEHRARVVNARHRMHN